MNKETLRPALRTDLVGSAISALVVIAAAGPLSDGIGVPTSILIALGIVLIPWVGFLYLTTRRATLRAAEVTVVVVGNLAWAVAAPVIILGFPTALSTGGKWVVGLFSLAVLAIGFVELRGLIDLRTTAEEIAVRQRGR